LYLSLLADKWVFMLIVTANAKGGVGKSTLAVHLACWLHERGRKVILVDSDVQSSSAQWMQEAEPNIPIVALPTTKSVLEIIPSLQAQADFVIADGPAGIAELTRALLIVADIALIPCGPSVLDLRAAQIAVNVLRDAQTLNGGKPEPWLVLNKLQKGTRLGRDLVEASTQLGIPVAKSVVHLRQVYPDAAGQGSVVWRLGRRGKEASIELNELFGEVTHVRTETNVSSTESSETSIYSGFRTEGNADSYGVSPDNQRYTPGPIE
jgi:chromosome partitioning protein